MSVFEAILLGLIQGLTEFIPISSSGHLVLAQHVFNGASEHLFLEWINIGTVAALLVYFRRRIWQAGQQVLYQHDYRLVQNIFIASLPAGLIGYSFAHIIESNAFFGSVWTVVVMLLLVGVVMVVLETLPKRPAISQEASLPAKRALVIGVAQALALIPGTSRSGATIIAGRLMGYTPAAAAEFSFLLSIPIMLGVIAKVLVKDADRAYFLANLEPLLWGNLAAFVSGLLAVGFLMTYLKRHGLALFGWYRIILAVVITGVLLLQ